MSIDDIKIRKILTSAQACELLQINAQQLRRLIAKRQIPAYKPAGHWRFFREELEEWHDNKSKNNSNSNRKNKNKSRRKNSVTTIKKCQLTAKEGRKEYNRQYYIINKEKANESSHQYRLQNKEKLEEYFRQYRIDNRERLNERDRQYKKDHPEIIKKNNQLRRARKKNLSNTLTVKEWQKILDDHFHRCHYCGIESDKLQQEHKIPVAKGGGYTAQNIVPACQRCNNEKYDKDYKKFAKNGKNRLQLKLFED